MFRGPSKVTLDAKGRLAIPSRHRDRIIARGEGHLIVTIDRECLLIYTLPDWEEIERKLIRLPSLHERSRAITHLLLAHAIEQEMDGNGRILIPKEHRTFAGLDRQVMLLGLGQKFELWDEERWNARRDGWLAQAEGVFENLPEELEKLTY